MKKILSLLGAISLFASSSAVVVSCKKDRYDKVTLNPELAKQIIAALAGDPSLVNKDFGDIFSSSDATTIIVRIINDLIARKYGYDSTNSILSKLGLSQYESENSEGYLPEKFTNTYEEQAGTVAEDLLFTEYTKSISGTRLDFSQINTKLFSLNPIEKVTVNTLDGGTTEVNPEATITFGSDNKVWAILAETQKDGTKIQNLPELSDLTQPIKDSTFKVNGVRIAPKTALKLRFQDYFKNELMKNIISNLLTMSYMDSSLFSILPSDNGEMSPFINTSSTLFSKTQSWFTTNTTGEKRNWTTNVRMVWSLKFKKDNEKKVRDELDKLKANNTFDFSNGHLSNTKKLKDVINQLGTDLKDVIYNDDNSNAYDSFFGVQGYKGFTIFENGTAIGNNPISGKNYETAVKESTKSSILLKSGSPFFEDSEDKNIEEIVFSLPIYMIELLGASEELGETARYKIQGAGNSNDAKAIEYGWSGYGSSKTKYKDIWNQDNNKEYHSLDVQEIAANDSFRNAMINQIKYMVSQDSTISELAKTVLYTKYLNADDIYYAGLYNSIGKYIKNDKDADD
ncbi:hypothetical protein SGLAD_v1c07890 [Spiroplasma gladiatoris]|uniref:Lipoprotein n=1 Tax=Spiroplasma gladiatoris TaxID=2143 RepID=A0A4P7AJK3_9MOLU|nr:lipoprotein [Spiroplasma gladiatoris]QBQ07988.1 hypothetical protein SGLAD_v1c07890 [Spiroplasma gladiatoris]